MKEAIMYVVFFVVLLGGYAFINELSCHAEWRNSGLKTRYSLLAGCQVILPDGRSLPARTIRDVDVLKPKEELSK